MRRDGLPRLLPLLSIAALLPAAALAAPSWPANPPWQSYNVVPTSAAICPVRVVSTSGAVTNAAGLLCNGGGGTTLQESASGVTPRIVLDYGQDVGGIPFFGVAAASGAPQMKAGYNETLQYLTDDGGDTPPLQYFGNGEGDPSRADTYVVNGPSSIVNPFPQGGERYQVLTLTSPGSVTLNTVGITYIADRTQAASYGGYFVSSDDLLNRIWYSGAYTAQLVSVPDHSFPAGYQIAAGALDAHGNTSTGGSDIGYYSPGVGWTDYTMSFQTSISNFQAGWAVRVQDAQDGLVFLLNTQGLLQAWLVTANQYQQIASVSLPYPVVTNHWYAVSTVVNDSVATVSIDGTQQLSVSTAGLHPGSVGFREYGTEEALFQNLVVSNGESLTLSFSQPSDLAGFAVPGSNVVPAILDGAKRDRLVWSGDVDVAGPTLAYTLGNTDYLKGSLQLFATRQHTSGFVEGVIPASFPLTPATNLTSDTGPYSATYSIYFVLGAYDHLMFSGDLAFARSIWPIVQNELSWNAAQVDSRGLFDTNDGDGADWDFYDANKVGSITEYNVLYYRALLNAAVIGDAIGEASAAAGYRAQAAGLATAINLYMYDATSGLYRISDSYPAIAQDANVLAVLAGLPPPGQAPQILANLKQMLWTTPYGPLPFNQSLWSPRISTFISGYEVQARYAANDSVDAETLMRTVYGWLINPANADAAGTMWEDVAPDGTPGLGSQTSLSHGWATGAVSALSGYTMGIRPVAPGFASWRVQPHPGTLAWVEGQAPTPYGPIAVKWGQQNGHFAMRVDSPKGTVGTIAVPTLNARHPVVTLDNAVVWRNGQAVYNGNTTGASSDGLFVYLPGIRPGRHLVHLGG